jgi:hypothetical protein
VTSALANPALEQFVAHIGHELLLAQVLIRRAARGYELRHEEDRSAAEGGLRLLPPSEARALAQNTASGAFRPLKSAPNLQRGWRLAVADDAELESALNQLYPGAIADWHAAQSDPAPVTDYRAFTNRQTGMYRITQMLSDAQAGSVAKACCHRDFCLKRRLWMVAGLAPDAAGDKSMIPCLEPCAVLLEFARTAMRLEQEEKARLELAPGEIRSLQAALETTLRQPDATLREADFSAAGNPRRLRLLLEKIHSALNTTARSEENQIGVAKQDNS